MDKTLMLNEIKKHYNFKTDSEFAKFLGIKPQVLSNWKTRNTFDPAILYTKCEDLHTKWILTGEGPMLNKDASDIAIEHNESVNNYNTQAEDVSQNRKTCDYTYDLQKIPVFNLEATMGLVPTINNNGLDENKIIDFINIPNLPSCDGAIYASGDSMYPLLKAGDLIAYKKINLDLNALFYGEIYLLAVKIDEDSTYKTIKFVHKSDVGPDHLKLVSQNQHHPPIDIPIKQIAAIALVRASIRIHN